MYALLAHVIFRMPNELFLLASSPHAFVASPTTQQTSISSEHYSNLAKDLRRVNLSDTDWSFEALLNNYQVEEVTASAPTGFDFSGVFPEGFTW